MTRAAKPKRGSRSTETRGDARADRRARAQGAQNSGAPNKGAPNKGAPNKGAPDKGAPNKGAQKKLAQRRKAKRAETLKVTESTGVGWGAQLIALATRLNYPLELRTGVGLARLEEACTHRTFAHEVRQAQRGHAKVSVIKDNQRLEFLGDAVLGLSVANELMRRYPDASEGELSARRARLINADALSEVARREGLEGYLRVGRGENNMGDRARRARLADLTEAVIGSLYLDLGLEAAQNWIQSALAPLYQELERDRDALDAKTALQQWTHRHQKLTPTYRHEPLPLDPDNPNMRAGRPGYAACVLLAEREIGYGEAPSKREAEFEAARDALTRLKATSS